MRALQVSLALLAPLLAGCIGDGTEKAPVATGITLADIVVPEGATLLDDPLGAILEWLDVALPFETNITIPPGATIVSIQTTGPENAVYRTYLKDQETGRRRCNPDLLDAWNVPATRGAHACSGMTAIDPPGSNWTAQVNGIGIDTAATVRVVYDERPVDGTVAGLDLSLLSMPDHAVQATTGAYIPSFDGTELWVEVTLPEGEGPFPTIIASSPYNLQYGRIGQPDGRPAMWEYFTHDWARRGYAIVNADVRGYGLSGGCVEVWGENEQKDQKALVEWAARQTWSDGNIGFYGQSYVATTPVAAAVQAPDALKAIIAVAPVISAYDDWHYGGVPNGENTGSPLAYQTGVDENGQNSPDPTDIPTNAVKGICDPTLVARANDPRAVYDDFYRERDFKLRADKVTAAVLFTQGFEDSNVKSAMIPGWFNELSGPKLGLFGHWVHQHPTRADEEILFLGWMDQYVKGLPLGFERLAPAEIVTNVGTVRQATMWPDPALPETLLWPDLAGGTLTTDGANANGATLNLVPREVPDAVRGGDVLSATYTLTEDLAVSGVISLHVRGTLEPHGNAFLRAQLYDVTDNETALITFGAFNLAHENGHDKWEAVTGPSDVRLTFLPTEHVFQAGHRLELRISGTTDPRASLGLPNPYGTFTFGAHDDGMGALHLPTVEMTEYVEMARTMQP